MSDYTGKRMMLPCWSRHKDDQGKKAIDKIISLVISIPAKRFLFIILGEKE